MRPIVLLGACLILSLSSCKGKDKKVEVTTIAANKPAAAAPSAEPATEDKAPAATHETKAVKEESPVPDIPEGRSKPPTFDEWRQAEAINTQEWNSQAENCEMKIVREWLKVYCHGDITEYSELSGFGEKLRDYFAAVRKGRSADFVVRLRKGKTMKLKIHRTDARDAVLYVSWPRTDPKPAHVALGRGAHPEEPDESKKVQSVKRVRHVASVQKAKGIDKPVPTDKPVQIDKAEKSGGDEGTEKAGEAKELEPGKQPESSK